MRSGERLYLAFALFTLFALAGAAVMTGSQRALGASAQPGLALPCADQPTNGDGATSAVDEIIREALEFACGDEPEAGEGAEQVQPGTLDDGRDLLPQASVTVEQAVAAAQGAAAGPVGEVELERVSGALVFKIDIGNQDVKVDASNGTVMSVTPDD